jgi:cytochrome bd-type quinol oxidase subunit 2
VSLLRNHAVLMLLYSLGTAGFFTLLWKQGRSERIRFFLFVFLSLFFGGIALGWAMYPFPLR